MRHTLLIGILVFSLIATPAFGANVDPRFEAHVPEPTVQPGATTQLSVTLVNDAGGADDTAATATNVRVTPKSRGPIDVESGTRLLGTMPDGQPTQTTVTISVPASIDAGTYRIPLEVTYEHDGDRETTTVSAAVRVEERARFVVVSSNASAPVGGSGPVSVTLRNVGERDATDAVVTLESTTADVRFGESNAASRFVGTWESNETHTVTYDATIASAADPRPYSLDARVRFQNGDGVDADSGPLSVGVRPLPEQSFAIENVESTLRVNQDGALEGELVNTGPLPVENAVLVFEETGPTVAPSETEIAVGDLAAGERANFSFATEITGEAEPGNRQFTFQVRHSRDGDRVRSDALDVQAEVAAERPAFEVDSRNVTFTAGDSDRLVVTVTNARDQPVRDVSAKIYASSPLSTGDDEAFVERLGSGESATVVFDIGVGSSALSKTYSVKLDFRYDDAAGDTYVTDTYQIPVRVSEERGGGPSPILLGIVALLVVAGIGGYVYSRRQ